MCFQTLTNYLLCQHAHLSPVTHCDTYHPCLNMHNLRVAAYYRLPRLRRALSRAPTRFSCPTDVREESVVERCAVCLNKDIREEGEWREMGKSMGDLGEGDSVLYKRVREGTPDLTEFLDGEKGDDEEGSREERGGSEEFMRAAEKAIGVEEEVVVSDEGPLEAETEDGFEEIPLNETPLSITGPLAFRPKTPEHGKSLTHWLNFLSPVYEMSSWGADESRASSPAPQEPLKTADSNIETPQTYESPKAFLKESKASPADEPSKSASDAAKKDVNEPENNTEDVPSTPKTPANPPTPNPAQAGTPYPPETPFSVTLARYMYSPSTAETPSTSSTSPKSNPQKGKASLADELQGMGYADGGDESEYDAE